MSGTSHVPFFSVIVPVLDEEKALPKLLDDLTHQTYLDFQVCIVDGGSKDQSCTLTEKFAKQDKRFTLLQSSQKNVSIQRNVGAKNTHSEYLVFLDADSRIPNFYLEGLHYHLMQKDVDGWTTFASSDSKRADTKFFAKILNFSMEGGALLKKPYAIGAALGVKRAMFNKIHGFNESLQFMEDTRFARDIAKHHGRFVAYKDPTFTYNMRRYRKEGLISLIVRLIPPYLNSLVADKTENIPDIYPMNGGSYYISKKRTLLEFRELQRTIRKIAKSRKKRIQEVVKQLQEFLQSLDDRR